MSKDVAVLGVGMHPWGKWGQSFVKYGVAAARAALADSGVDWQDVDFIVGGETVRNGYGGYVAGATFAQALGWNGARVATSYAACATGAQALDTARARILAGLSEVALVVGADTTPKGFLAPVAGERWDDPDWLRFRLMGMTNPAYFALNARRRIDLYGATAEDFANVKVKNAKHGLGNPNARYRKEVTVENVLASPVVSNPLHLLDICATSDGGAAILLTSMEYARKMGIAEPVRIKAISTVTPTFPQTIMDMPNFSTDSSSAVPAPERTFKESIATPHTKKPGSLPKTSTSPKSTTSLPPWNWTGSKTLPSASGARPSTSCVRVTPVSEAASRSIRPVVSRASAKPFPHRHLRRCASSLGSFVDRPKAVRSKAPASVSPPTKVCSDTAPR